MDRNRFVSLALFAFGLVIASFFVLGFSRLVFSFRTAQLFAAPIGLAGFALTVYLFVRATLAQLGIWQITDPE